MTALHQAALLPRGRWHRDSLEFARVVNLSDAVFAIAMTLLAFKVEAPVRVASTADLLAVAPQATAFVLSFAVVANFWWHHHGLLALLEVVDGRFMVWNFILLGAVALVPFPTDLIGRHPGSSAPAVLYLLLMVAITAANVQLVRCARRGRLWSPSAPDHVGKRLATGWSAMLAMTGVALLIALLAPLAGLAALLLTAPAERLATRRFRRPGAPDREKAPAPETP